MAGCDENGPSGGGQVSTVEQVSRYLENGTYYTSNNIKMTVSGSQLLISGIVLADDYQYIQDYNAGLAAADMVGSFFGGGNPYDPNEDYMISNIYYVLEGDFEGDTIYYNIYQVIERPYLSDLSNFIGKGSRSYTIDNSGGVSLNLGDLGTLYFQKAG